jgi:hypothetical protein
VTLRGSQAAALLLSHIEREPGARQSITMPVRLVVRQSVASPETDDAGGVAVAVRKAAARDLHGGGPGRRWERRHVCFAWV